MAKTGTIVLLVVCTIGALVGLSASFVFSYYSYYYTGFWAFSSGIMACLSINLLVIHLKGKIDEWYTFDSLSSIDFFGFSIGLFSFFSTIWYIFYAYYYAIPLLPMEDKSYETAIWCFMTTKWSVTLSAVSRNCARALGSDSTGLINPT